MRSPVRDLEARLTQAKSAGECLAALLDLANLHAAEFRNREGLRSAREALNIARARRDTVAIGRALAAATLCHYQRGDYLSAVATGLDAVAAYADADRPGRSSALQSIALALHCVKASELADVTARRAVADAVEARDGLREGHARSVLGVILAESGRQREARREFRSAAALYRRDGDALCLKKATANIGHTYRYQGNAEADSGRGGLAQMRWRQARRVYETALLSLTTEADDAIVLGALAECECRLGELPQALAHVEAALARTLDMPVIEAPCHVWHARILQATGDLKGAERACERAREAAQRLEHGDVLATCLQLQSHLNDLQGRFETAQDLERRAKEVALERDAALGQVRQQLGALWARYSICLPDAPADDTRAA
jgi:tetratricopeptide (TPR) repeat protein